MIRIGSVCVIDSENDSTESLVGGGTIVYLTDGSKKWLLNDAWIEGEAFADTDKTELNGVNTIKIHRLSADTTITTNAWTNCNGFVKIDEESSGAALSLNVDNKTIDINETGMYQFGGCVHIQNNTVGHFSDAKILTRLCQNSTIEMKCSQRGKIGTLNAGNEDIISYNGTAFLTKGDTVNLQYFTDEVDMEFNSNIDFEEHVAYTLWLTKIK